MEVSQRQVDLIFVIVTSVVLLVVIFLKEPIESTLYVADAVTGLTSLVGILVAIIVFILPFRLSNTDSPRLKKWSQVRIYNTLLALGIGISFVFIAYPFLIDGYLHSAFVLVAMGTLLIFLLLMRTLFYLISDEEETS